MSRRGVVAAVAAVAAAGFVAACTGGSNGTSTPSATATVTDTVTSTAPTSSATTVPPTSTSSGGSTSGSSGNASGPGLCTPTVMTYAVAPGDGAAGTIYTAIVATNASQQPCVTTGWPGVAVLDSTGKQVAQAQRMGAEGATLTVQPGQKIHAVLTSTDVSDSPTGCRTQPAILFTMPDNTDSTQIKGVPVTTCHVWIQAFRPGSAG